MIYGANAAGKSNLVEVFKFIQECVMRVIPPHASTKFCKSKESNAKRPSKFELQFTINGKFYAYGFIIILQKRKIVSEWMYELFQNGTSKTIFEWQQGKKPIIGEPISLREIDKVKMKTYLDDFDENASILFLSFMNMGKKYTQASKLKFFRDIYGWICYGLEVCKPHNSLTSFEYYYDETSLHKINSLIKRFDTGISEVCIEEISLDELKKELTEPLYNQVMEDITKSLEEGIRKVQVSMRSNRNFFNIESTDNHILKVTTIRLKHNQSFFDFNFHEESDGTKRLFELLDILLNKSESKVYVIDEMERSLHPVLTYKFIELCEKMHPNQKIQLIFTTHESSIMDQELFRRDEIWFVEREDTNSHVYSLDKFKERYDKKLSKAYLEGRYGAIPMFSSFEFKEV